MEERIGSYPNAKKGINRIFLGELIAILGMVIIAIGSGILAVKGQTMTDLSTYTSGANIAALVILIGGLIVFQHRSNIQRLIHGTESKFSFHRKKE